MWLSKEEDDPFLGGAPWGVTQRQGLVRVLLRGVVAVVGVKGAWGGER